MIEKLKNWWISIMPSIGLAPMVEEESIIRAEFYKSNPSFAGILEMHEPKSIDWLDAMIAVRAYRQFKEGYEFGKTYK